MNNFYIKLLEILLKEKDYFVKLVNSDNYLGVNAHSDDILNYLEFSNNDNNLSKELTNNIIITDGSILTILKILNDLKYYRGEYIIYINNDNIGTITYLVDRANRIFKDYKVNVKIKIDYRENYNYYLNSIVNIIGNEKFVNICSKDFIDSNNIIL